METDEASEQLTRQMEEMGGVLSRGKSVPADGIDPRKATEMRKKILADHNDARAKKKVPALKLNAEMTCEAQQKANEMALNNALRSKIKTNYSELLYSFYGVNSKVEECVLYFMGNGGDSSHAVQILSPDGRELGIGVARSAAGTQFVCLLYHPSPRQRTSAVVTTDGAISTNGYTPPARAAIDINAFRMQVLADHNRLRALHGSPPLSLDQSLNDMAQKNAEHLAATNVLKHSQNGTGENLAVIGSRSPEESTQMWYDEIKEYDFSKHGFASNTGHFTQVVWKETRRVGVGVARGKNGSLFVCANYLPLGNCQGKFPENVLPLKK